MYLMVYPTLLFLFTFFSQTNLITHRSSSCVKYQLDNSYCSNLLPTKNLLNFRLNEISKIKNYFESEIKDRDTMVKKLNKCITGFDYTDKILIVLSATFSGVSIFSHLKIKKYTGLISSALVLSFSLTTTIIKKNCYMKQNKERKSTINLLSWVRIN